MLVLMAIDIESRTPLGLVFVLFLFFIYVYLDLKLKKMKKKRTIKNNNYKARIFSLESKPKVMKHFTFVPPKVSV